MKPNSTIAQVLRRPRSLSVAAGGAALAVAMVLPVTAAAATTPAEVGTWTASPIAGATSSSCPAGAGGIANQTVRDIVYPSISGSKVRVRLSNTFGTAPLGVGAVSIAVAKTGASTVASTTRALTFGGKKTISIPPGAEVLSDWVDFSVTQGQDLALSVYVPELTGPATFHAATEQNSFLSTTGNFAKTAGAADFPTTISCWMFADGIDVAPAARVLGSVVAFGDSITDGVGSNVNANDRWPNILARRFDDRAGKTLSVVDEGISGNRVLSDAGTAGVSALARFGRDALAQPGAKDIILLEGINDIGQSDLGTTPLVTSADLIAGYQQLIAQAHAAGLRIFGATLTPFKGAFYWSPQGEQTREAVNKWILTSGAFDGTIDFAAITADPDDALVYNPAFDSGDHLHPNDAGYQAMADAINLKTLIN
ncbi:MAG TPA: SGNH/GDSL hydrolase family protein [Pseudonocardiaceae bacterium]|nr:SGNH/GDSL hydrolase family protein [Pseudonocardiaceae bacterium]